MRFPFGSAKSKHLKLVGPLGKEHSVDARVEGGELRLCAAAGSQVRGLRCRILEWRKGYLCAESQHIISLSPPSPTAHQA